MGACQEWDSNPRLQGRLRPERSALDRSAILTPGPAGRPLACLAPNVKPPPPPRTPPPSSWPPALVAPGLGAPAQSPAHRRRAAWASPGGDAVDAPQVPQPLSPSSAPRRRRAVSWSQGAGPSSQTEPCGASRPLFLATGPQRPWQRGVRSRVVVERSGCGGWRRPQGQRRKAQVPGGRRPAGDVAEARGVRVPGVAVLVSIVVSIPACHAGDRGSIPRRGGKLSFLAPCDPTGQATLASGGGAAWGALGSPREPLVPQPELRDAGAAARCPSAGPAPCPLVFSWGPRVLGGG